MGFQTNNNLLGTWDYTMSEEVLKFSIISPQKNLASTPSLKQALV